MEILFLTISDQQNHPLQKYADLHRTYDFKPWEEGFRSISKSVHIFDYYASFVFNGPVTMENCIRDLVQKHNIQLLIVTNLYYELAPTFLDNLRNIGCRSMIVFFDCSMRFDNTNRFYLGSFDYYLTQESVDSKALYKPFGVEPEFFPASPCASFYNSTVRNFDRKILKSIKDVVFVGAKIADRAIFIDYLKNSNIDIAVFGKGWEAGMVSTEEMLASFNSSKISLNFIKTIDGSGRVQFKARIFEIIMAGGFVLSEHCDELLDYFDIGREIDTFKSPYELLDKLRFYLKNNALREKMAAQAKERVEKNYSFESNWSRYLTDIDKGKIKSEYPNSEYIVPPAAIEAFIKWNLSFIYGRIMIGQLSLAYQQYSFCRRELKGLVCDLLVIKAFFKWFICNFMKTDNCRLFKRIVFISLIIVLL